MGPGKKGRGWHIPLLMSNLRGGHLVKLWPAKRSSENVLESVGEWAVSLED